ncbi:MAG: hypothetical protein QXU18_12565 [Thermoplasmatales archaeon]
MDKGDISLIINNLVRQDIVYRMALTRGIVNYSSLAKKLKKSVDRITGRDIALNTIVKSLTRIRETENLVEPYDALSQLEISLEYGLVRKTTDFLSPNVEPFLIALKTGDGYDILYKDVNKEGLALLRIRMKERFSEIPGITVLIISILESYKVEIRYIYRFGHEIWFLIPKEQGTLALEKLAFVAGSLPERD